MASTARLEQTALGSPSLQERLAAVKSLSADRSPAAGRALLEVACASPEAVVSSRALIGLHGRRLDPEARVRLAGIVRSSPEVEPVRHALRLLATVPADEASFAEIAFRVTADPRPPVRAEAAAALHRGWGSRARAHLEVALAGERAAAVRALIESLCRHDSAPHSKEDLR